MGAEKLLHENYWACMDRATRIVDSWPDWEKGSPSNTRISETSASAASAVSSDRLGAVALSEKSAETGTGAVVLSKL